jgi:hypothetical protein
MLFLRLFKNNRAGGVAVVIILALGLFVRTFIMRGEVPVNPGMSLYNLIFGNLQDIPVLNAIASLAILLISGFILNGLGLRFSLLGDRSFMPAIFYLLFAASLPESRHLSPALAGSLFYLICFGMIFDVPDKEPDTFSIFRAGLVLAAGSLFYLKLIWFLPVIWISLVTLRSATWREMFYPVTALLIAGLLLFVWYWGIRDDGGRFLELLRVNLSFKGGFAARHYSGYLLYGFFLLLIIIASLYMIYRFQARKTVIQNIYQVMFYMFVGGVLFYIFIERFNPHTLVYIAIPASYILSNYFHRHRNPWIHELFMWVLVGLVVFVQLTG